MNKIKSMIVLVLMLFVGGQMMGQTNGALYLGASFPMKDYAEYDDGFALISDEDDAAASLGFNAGIKWYFNMGVPGLGVLLSIDGFYNGLNDGAKNFYKNRENALDLLGNNVTMSTPKYFNVPVMLGLNYNYRINSNLGLFIEAGAGGNARFITSYSESYKDVLGEKHTGNVNYETALSFAFQVGAGLEVAKNLVIGCSFYNLGKAPVKAEKTGNIITTPMPNGSSIRPMMILARIGFSF